MTRHTPARKTTFWGGEPRAGPGGTEERRLKTDGRPVVAHYSWTALRRKMLVSRGWATLPSIHTHAHHIPSDTPPCLSSHWNMPTQPGGTQEGTCKGVIVPGDTESNTRLSTASSLCVNDWGKIRDFGGPLYYFSLPIGCSDCALPPSG